MLSVSTFLEPLKFSPRKLSQTITRLTEPSASIEGNEPRFQARLLSTLLLVFLALGGSTVIYQWFTVPDFVNIVPILLASLTALFIAYILSRTHYFQISKILAIVCPSIAAYASSVSGTTPEISILFVLISILLSSILLSWRWAISLIIINLGITFSILNFATDLTASKIAPYLSLLVILSCLMLVSIWYRNALENNRQNELATNEKRYRLLINQSPLGTIIYSPQGQPRMYNQSAIDLWNLSPQDLEYIQTHYNILEDKQLAATGILPLIEKSFSGEAVMTPANKYEFLRHDENGKRIIDERWIISYFYPIKDENQNIIEIVLLQEDITERKKVEADIQNRNRELASLNRAISAANATLKIEEVLQYVCLELTIILDASLVVASLLNDEGTELSVVSSVQPAVAPNIKGMVFSLEPFKGTPLAKKILVNKEPITILDIQHSPYLVGVQHQLEQQNIAALLVIPLVVRATIIGVVGIGNDKKRQFDKEVVNLAYSVVSSISPAIHNAQLHEKAQLHATTLEERIRERTRELADTNKRLQKLANIKDEFVSNVSHELRTPITNIKLYHDLLALNPQKSDQYIATLKRETDRLEHIVESLLQLSRLDQGMIQLHTASIDLNALLQIFVADQITQAEKTGIQLTFCGDSDLPQINCDMRQIGQVLSILLINAINYTPEGGLVEVSTKLLQNEGQSWGTLWVQDSGPGTTPDEKPYLFDRFFRGKVGRESAHPGTGLGLAIAKEIIEHHNGRIEVSDSNISETGAAFIVWLPITSP